MTIPAFQSEPPTALRLRDPLSEVTRKERRALLGISLFSFAVTKSGLLPTEIAALGVKLAAGDQRNVLFLLIAICTYYLLAFIIYAASDLTAWLVTIRDSLSERMVHQRMNNIDDYELEIYLEVEDKITESSQWLLLADVLVRPISGIRAFFEFLLPIGVGLYAIIVLAIKSAV